MDKIIKELLKNVDPTPFYRLVLKSTEDVKLLEPLFINACCDNQIETVRDLLRLIDPSINDNEGFRLACTFGHTEIVEILLSDSRVDPTSWKNSGIRSSSRFGHLEIVKLLLADPRVNPKDDDSAALYYAKKYGHKEIVELLSSVI